MDEKDSETLLEISEEVDISIVRDTWSRIRTELKKAVIGMDDVIEFMFIALLSQGHVLLEGPPGIAKTYAAQNFAATLGLDFKRIQMTPDLLPSDIIGTMIYDQREGVFKFKRGPIFTNILLVDEINRAPPKTQAALLEAMEEKQVTVEGITYLLPKPFIVLATQNPIEMEGTYPLPEAQVSRFMLYLKLSYPDPEAELKIIELKNRTLKRVLVEQVTSEKTILLLQKIVQEKVVVSEAVMKYIRDIVIACRKDARILLGCSPRASIALLLASKAYAAMQGRDYVIPDDVKHVALPALRHRIILKPEIELSGVTTDDVVISILRSVSVPE
ncbi:MAG: AAA family ATPase [Candidatus Njordarchaeales archaeon]